MEAELKTKATVKYYVDKNLLESPATKQRKKREKRTSGHFQCKNCMSFFADSATKLAMHERSCERLKQLESYREERDSALIRMNENGDYCCKACGRNFKKRKDNLLDHVKKESCPNGARMPPKPFINSITEPSNLTAQREPTFPEQKRKKTNARKLNDEGPTDVVLNKKSTCKFETMTNKDESAILAKTVRETNDNDSNICYFNQQTAQAASDDRGNFNCGTLPFTNPSQYGTAINVTHPIQSTWLSYQPSYTPSYSNVAEYSPTSIAFDEIIRCTSRPHRGYNQTKMEVIGQELPRLPIDTFPGFGIHSKLLSILLTKMGYMEPTAVQRYTIPIMNENRDLIACSQNSSGKTLAYLIPIVNYLLTRDQWAPYRKPVAIVIVPTHELASQVFFCV